MSNSYINLMIDSLKKKVDILKKISGVNAEQKLMLDEARFDPEKLDEIVAQKESLVSEINKLDNGFETVYDRVKDELVGNKAAYAEQIAVMQQLIKEIVELTTSIEAEEKRMKVEIDNQFSKIKQAVKETKKNSKAVSNYYKNMSKLDLEPQFMDKKK